MHTKKLNPSARAQQARTSTIPFNTTWIGTWGVAPASATMDPSNNGGLTFSQQTLRQVVHTSHARNH